MSMEQVAINSRAIRAGADRLEKVGYDGDAAAFVEALIVAVIAEGYRPMEPPPTPRGPGSTEDGRKAARALYEATRREKEQ